jgi:hypothetical protein
MLLMSIFQVLPFGISWQDVNDLGCTSSIDFGSPSVGPLGCVGWRD